MALDDLRFAVVGSLRFLFYEYRLEVCVDGVWISVHLLERGELQEVFLGKLEFGAITVHQFLAELYVLAQRLFASEYLRTRFAGVICFLGLLHLQKCV